MSEHANFPIPDGLSNVRLQLRDGDGRVTETIEASEHRCTEITCDGAAHCETCGGTGSTRILLIGSTEDGMDIFVCYPCLAEDSFCRTETEPSRCENPWHEANPTARLRPCPECPAREREEEATEEPLVHQPGMACDLGPVHLGVCKIGS